MARFATVADSIRLETEMPWQDRGLPTTIYQMLSQTAKSHGSRKAVSFQLTSEAKDRGETLTWAQYHAKVTQAANLFRGLGVGEQDTVAYILPNSNETAITLIGGTVAGIVAPINPLLEAEQIAAILRETNAKVVVTLRAFPKTDIAQKVAQALTMAPGVKSVLEVDLLRYLSPPKSWIVPLIRSKNPVTHNAKVLNFNAELDKQPTELQFEDATEDRVAAYFHTGGTTGMPKVAQHKYSGMIYNGWLGEQLIFTPDDNVICPLPLFHVFACHVILMAMIASGAHVVFPTPAGYRGDGVFDNFWKLIERWQISFIITVPTAISALMQRPVDADISTVKNAFSGSSPLPVELFRRFEEATKVNIYEGYGLTEATCLVAINPVEGEKKIGSVGIRFPYTDVRILHFDEAGNVTRECDTDEIGEICVLNPGVFSGHTYTEAEKNTNLFAWGTHLRTGDLGRVDSDEYLFITGRAKDLIIRGGHNIDPALIEEALAGHEAVAMVGAIGQPDSHSGEIPCAYVELVAGASASVEELMDYAKAHVSERAAHPRYIEILPELPKTAVGKVFKPDLRKRAITRIFNEDLSNAGVAAKVADVTEDKKRGLVARLEKTGDVDEAAAAEVLGKHIRPFEWI
jgi:acyl-CoA synthetase (AMP-forming)/AMP-acid ligase II